MTTTRSALLEDHFNWVAENGGRTRRVQAQFHAQVRGFYVRQIPAGQKVLELGSGVGDLLVALSPAQGRGYDLSSKMVSRARAKHSPQQNIQFLIGDAEQLQVRESFDYIVLNFLIGYLTDVQAVFMRAADASHARTRVVITSLNHVWLWPLKWAQWLRLVNKQPESNWLSSNDIINLLEMSGWEVVESGTMQLCPFDIPLITPFFNRFIANLPVFRSLGITQTIIARPRTIVALPKQMRCSVIVPARNESGNILAALERIPVMGAGTEIIFVEGNSKDDTWETIQREVANYKGPHQVKAIKQPGKGKWDAVRAGFEIATGEVLVIQDADLTAPPEDLPKFFEAIISGSAEFANGSRLVYPMESGAMRFLNFLGNKFFATALSYVLGQPVKDSLCGTKMLLKTDYHRIRSRIAELGDFDPFGDFNLLFGAALLKLRIRDIPVRYKDRTYGETNISRFKHGWLLLRMTSFGLFKIRWR
ncbi:MAG TPA: glycosyltransferase [Opitutaceae bacterium]